MTEESKEEKFVGFKINKQSYNDLRKIAKKYDLTASAMMRIAIKNQLRKYKESCKEARDILEAEQQLKCNK